MKIIPINNYNKYNNCQPSFKAYSTEVLLKDGKIAYKTLSNFYRADIHWVNFVNYIIHKYRNVDKVNIVNHACSAGYEPYSLLMLLIKTLGEESKKFLPIIARDIDEDIINFAKNCKLPVANLELSMTKYHGGDIFNKNFEVSRIQDAGGGVWNDRYIVSCNTNLRQNIDFCKSDIFNDKDFINKENTVLLFRNVWKYLGVEKIAKLADFLGENMKQSSVLVIGEFDIANHVDEILVNRGFRSSNCMFNEQLIFEAPKG